MATLDWTTFTNSVNGKSVNTKKTRHGINPNTEEALPEVPVSTQEDVDEAVSYARKAFPAWKALSWDERAGYLTKLADAIEHNGEGFVKMLGEESGKPVSTARIELFLAVGILRSMSTLRIDDEVLEDSETRSATLRYTPIGVGAGLVPWNWPLLLGNGKVVSALLTGNTFIMKPSPFTPYSNLKVGELANSIFPPGVFQVLSGGDDLGPMLTEHEGIQKISFTGSTFTGKKVMESCSRTLKRVTLELGGNDAAIVCEDADLNVAVPTIGQIIWMSSSQICMSVKRIYVHESIYDDFKAKLVEFAKNVKVGVTSDPEVLVGPIQNEMQYKKVQNLYDEIKKSGWNALLGAAIQERNSNTKGYFIPPEIIDNPAEDSRIVVEEPFGPIVPLLKWSNEDDVIARANNSLQGLGGSVWSKNIERATQMAKSLESGSAWVNCHFTLDPKVPFGGMKHSGMGREWGVEGLKGWCEMQSLWVMKPQGGA